MNYRTCFVDCERDLLAHGAASLLAEWRASPEVREFTRHFCHERIYRITLAELEVLRSQQEGAGDSLAQALSAAPITEIEDFFPDFPFVHLFHLYLEEQARVPTFAELWSFLRSPAHRSKCYDGFAAALAGSPYYPPHVVESAIKRRAARAYCASFYELWTAAWLRQYAHVAPNYHLFADTQLQTDLWYGQTIVCMRVPSLKLERKKDPSAWARDFHVIHLDIGRHAGDQLPLPTEDQLRTLAALAPVPGTVTTIRSDGEVVNEHPISLTTQLGAAFALAPSPLSKEQAAQQLGLAVMPRYSLALIGIEPTQEQAASLLKAGLKLYILSASPPTYPELDAFRQARLLHVQACPSVRRGERPHVVVDGRASDIAARILARIGADGIAEADFNFEQFVIEHALPEEHLRVRAGAGTGKTWVMVQRVLFLLHACEGLSPREITLVTFTREATRIMRERLRQAIEVRYRLTGQIHYLEWLEDLSFMHVSTIHSFARRLLKAVGSTLGYGQDVQIREFSLERQRILGEILDEHLRDERVKRRVEDILAMPLYKFVNVADRYWHEMENKGLSAGEIGDIDWGQPSTPDSSTIQGIWQVLFTEAEQRLQAYKQANNAISLSDLSRQLRLAAKEPQAISRSGLSVKHLFVDEFQDTDDTQIELVATIQQMLGATIFVVGDIKQSIYRFRGATYTAFDVLAERLKQSGVELREQTLRKNYRTASNVLHELGRLFSAWGDKGWLPYGKDDALVGGTGHSGDLRVSPLSQTWKALRRPTLELIREARELPREGNPRTTILVRTNRQVETVKQWCDAAEIPCTVDVGGTFFRSPAVRDFLTLVSAMLYPYEPTALLNLLASPYSAVTVSWPGLLKLKGSLEALREHLAQPSMKPHPGWDDLVHRSRLQPVLSIIREAIGVMQPVQRYYDRRLAELREQREGIDGGDPDRVAALETMQYERNLDRLMELLHDAYSEDFLTLFSIHEWLRMQKATNHSEDEPRPLEELEELVGDLACMTVHKAKGNEFATVIVPFTSQRFRARRTELILEKQGARWAAGWQLIIDSTMPIWEAPALSNTGYQVVGSTEQLEVFREETRLLYVALTRCKQRLWTLSYQGRTHETWGYLLRAANAGMRVKSRTVHATLDNA